MFGEIVAVVFSSVFAAQDAVVAIFSVILFLSRAPVASFRPPPLVLMPPRVVVVFFLAVALVIEWSA